MIDLDELKHGVNEEATLFEKMKVASEKALAFIDAVHVFRQAGSSSSEDHFPRVIRTFNDWAQARDEADAYGEGVLGPECEHDGDDLLAIQLIGLAHEVIGSVLH